MLYGFLRFSPVSLTELCSFWYGLKDLFTLHKLSLTIKPDDVTSGRKDVDKYGQLQAAQGRIGKKVLLNKQTETWNHNCIIG